MALLWLVCVIIAIGSCQAYMLGSNVQLVRSQRQLNSITCTSSMSLATGRRGVLEGAAAGLMSILAIAEPASAVTKPKRAPVTRLPEGTSQT
jgi:hypothetical protein